MNILDLFLYTPFPGDERIKLTNQEISLDEFYSKIYTNAWFVSQLDTDENDDVSIVDVEKLRKIKTQFENDLNGYHGVPRLFYIVGYCGSGKSIYLGYLLKKFSEKQDNKIIKFDFAKTGTGIGQKIHFFGYDWSNTFEPANTLSYFINILLMEINRALSVKDKEKLAKYLSFYENVMLANDYYEYDETFGLIKQLYNNEIERKEYLSKMHQLFKAFLVDKDYTSKTVKEDIISEFLRLLFLLSYAETFNLKESKIIIGVDSLEHYLKAANGTLTEIYNSEIYSICSLLKDSLITFANLPMFESNSQAIYDKFRLIVACRDTSENMISPIDNQDAEIEYVITSEWFRASDILQKRIEYYDNQLQQRYELEDRSTVIKAFNEVLSDEVKNTGLYDKLHEMYNYNYRRMVRYLVETLSGNNLYEDYLDILSNYSTWKDNLKHARQRRDKAFQEQSSNMMQVCLTGARQAIVAGLLRNIAQTGFFNLIENATVTSSSHLGYSYARKILTYLCRRIPKDNILRADEYVPFNDLIHNALTKVNGAKLTNDDITIITNLLMYFSEPSRKFKWCQQIAIRYNDDNFSWKLLYETLCSIRDGHLYSNDYALKITNAGRFFLAHMSEFEYFAARYSRQTYNNEAPFAPLFCKANLERIGNRYKCISLIYQVKNSTFQYPFSKDSSTRCLDVSFISDEKFFYDDYGGKWENMYSSRHVPKFYLFKSGNIEFPHAERTLEKHISYLDCYRNYVLMLSCKYFGVETEEEADQIKENISTEILNVLEDYINKLQEFYDIQDDKGWYYCGGERNISPQRYDTSAYTEKLNSARDHILEVIRIIRK